MFAFPVKHYRIHIFMGATLKDLTVPNRLENSLRSQESVIPTDN